MIVMYREKGGGATCESREAEFLDLIGPKALRVFLLGIHRHIYQRISPPPPPPGQKWFETGCNVNIIFYGNLKCENSQDYAQKS